MVDEAAGWIEPKERRQLLRLPVEARAMLISSALGRVAATVIDLSQAGCRVRSRARCHRGDHLVLTIETFAPRFVEAAWWHDGEVGLAFSQPLAWAVVAEIVQQHPARPAPPEEPRWVPGAPIFLDL